MKKFLYIIFLLGTFCVFSQSGGFSRREFKIRVIVIDKKTNRPIEDAQVSVEGSISRFSHVKGEYPTKVAVGDQITVTHPNFETVFHTVRMKDDLKIYVEDFSPSKKDKSNSLKKSKKRRKSFTSFKQNIDSASYYKSKNIDKSIGFIEQILKSNPNTLEESKTYNLLGDVYLEWKQYDLAIENYKSSIQLKYNIDTQLKLAKTEFLFKKYSKSKRNYQKALQLKLTNYQKIKAYEGLGEVYFAEKKYKSAKQNLEKALVLAKKNLVTPKITDINSKLAEVYMQEGKSEKADIYYSNSLKLASKENKKRSLKEQTKVAEYLNKSNRYDEEIKLRQKTLKEAKGFDSDTINSQNINYNIGKAYILKQEYSNAIPYLKKSIKEANTKKDLVVKKDATKKLSEIYATEGDYYKALKTYEEYVTLVDTLYVKKEQEIIDAKKFSRKISANQNRIKSLEKDKELSNSKIDLANKNSELTYENNKRQKNYIYALIIGFILMSLLAYLLYRNTKQQKLANNLLALKSMRSQMNPHFIFNALNSVNSFIAVNDERNANRYLSQFSSLMRSVLENSEEDFIPLTKEIELLELYTKLEHNRFKNKFDYIINIEDTIELDNYKIPPMLLQPYIENAIWHGLRYRKEKGNLEILVCKKTENSIEIIISDDGVGRKKSEELKTNNQLKQKSKGMTTIKNRIEILNSMYKNTIKVAITNLFEDETGTKVSVIIKK